MASPSAANGTLTTTTANPGPAPRPSLPDWRPTHDHRALWDMLQRSGVQSFGDPQAAAVRWPLNRTEALAVPASLHHHALPHFGDYEDALAAQPRACSIRCCRLR